MSRPGPALAAIATTGYTAWVIRRMETDYRNKETFTPVTVGLLYSAYAATGAAFAWAVHRRAWPLPLPRPVRVAGAALATAGAAVSIAGAGRFGSGAQLSGIEPGSFVAGGLYRYSRNPQYLGLVTIFAGTAVAAGSGLAATMSAGVWAAFDRWIPSEERHLDRVFGDEYRGYATRIRRWI